VKEEPMIQIELEARVLGLTEADLDEVGNILGTFRAAVTYRPEDGTLFLSATVSRMSLFLELDQMLRNTLGDRNRFPDVMAYAVVNPASAA
jgi:hypothetical protein